MHIQPHRHTTREKKFPGFGRKVPECVFDEMVIEVP